MAMPYKNYQVTEIKTSDPVRIVVLLYEGAIKNLNQAIVYIDENKQPLATARISKTQEIVNYLRNTLDFEQGGEISVNLDRLYDYISRQLTEAQIKRDLDKIKEVIGLLQTLLEGWQGIAAGQTAGLEVPSARVETLEHTDKDGESETREAPRERPKLSYIVG